MAHPDVISSTKELFILTTTVKGDFKILIAIHPQPLGKGIAKMLSYPLLNTL
jgi:hypothetical protein